MHINQISEIPSIIGIEVNIGLVVNNMGYWSGLFVDYVIIICNAIMRIFIHKVSWIKEDNKYFEIKVYMIQERQICYPS